MLLVSQPAEPQAWATVSLTLDGTGATENRRRDCREEAHTAGIQLAAVSPIRGTLYFVEPDNYLEGTDVPKYVFGKMRGGATCKIALAKLTKLDALVPMTKNEPTGCKSVGAVDGSDVWGFNGASYEAAVVEAQFKVRAAGGNLFVADAMEQQGPHGQKIVVHGRGFACPAAEAQPAAQ